MTLKTTFRRLSKVLGWDFSELTPAEKFAALDEETQIHIATEMSLVAAMDLIILQRMAWNELLDNLSTTGIEVAVSPEMAERHEAITSRLQASMRVIGEELGIDETTLKGIGL